MSVVLVLLGAFELKSGLDLLKPVWQGSIRSIKGLNGLPIKQAPISKGVASIQGFHI